MEEIEVKYLNIDPAVLEKKLADIGARKIGEYFQRWYSFDYFDWRLDKDASWLRLRDQGNEVTLSFKKRLGVEKHDGTTQDTGMEEIEVKVDDFEKTVALILKLGFVKKHYAEKKRVRWERDNTVFDIDIYPALQPYLEIEAPSWEKIDEAIALLGLNPADKKIFSANQVYALNGIHVADYTRLTFDGIVKRNKKSV